MNKYLILSIYMYIVHTTYNIADNVTSNHAANGFSTLTQRNVYLVKRLDLVGIWLKVR